MSTCNRLDLQTLGSQPVMSENLPDQWFLGIVGQDPSESETSQLHV